VAAALNQTCLINIALFSPFTLGDAAAADTQSLSRAHTHSSSFAPYLLLVAIAEKRTRVFAEQKTKQTNKKNYSEN
jgi:hypothetical protein